jgi:hypothetical protein
MTRQRNWREWLTKRGEHQTPEYRIAEDARVPTGAPIDFSLGLLSSPQGLTPSSSGRHVKFTAIRRASSRVSTLACRAKS